MSVEVKEAVRVEHAPGCKKNKGCGPECKRRRDKGVFKAHITIKVPGRKGVRRRLTVPSEFCGTATEREAWAQQEHDKLKNKLTAGGRARVPTIEEFKKDFLDYGKASRQKAATACSWESILRNHIIPAIGKKRLDEVDELDIQAIKVRMKDYAPSSVNNVLATLSKMLKVAKRLKLITAVPVDSVELLKNRAKAPQFYEFDEFERIVKAATALGPRYLALVYIVAHAGLRPGEAAALLQSDIYWSRGANGEILVDKQVWRDITDSTKTNNVKSNPMTPELAAALKAIRHVGPEHVFLRDDGRPANQKVFRVWMRKIQRRAGLKVNGNVYTLRHTFASHLAMKGAGAKDIQELLGHTTLNMTMRYIHLTTSHKEKAVGLLSKASQKPAENGTRMALAAVPAT
jgi:integrase